MKTTTEIREAKKERKKLYKEIENLIQQVLDTKKELFNERLKRLRAEFEMSKLQYESFEKLGYLGFLFDEKIKEENEHTV